MLLFTILWLLISKTLDNVWEITKFNSSYTVDHLMHGCSQWRKYTSFYDLKLETASRMIYVCRIKTCTFILKIVVGFYQHTGITHSWHTKFMYHLQVKPYRDTKFHNGYCHPIQRVQVIPFWLLHGAQTRIKYVVTILASYLQIERELNKC